MSLTDEERNAIVKYRIERAFQSFEEAKNVSKMEMWSLLANRLYYSLYYISVALLINDGHITKTHSGMLALINQYYIKSGVLTVEEGRLIKRLFTLRQECDYDDFVYTTEDEIVPFIPLVESLLNKISSIINHSDC